MTFRVKEEKEKLNSLYWNGQKYRISWIISQKNSLNADTLNFVFEGEVSENEQDKDNDETRDDEEIR